MNWPFTRTELGLGLAQGYGFCVLGGTFILLARWMGPSDFGVFATLYSASVLVGTVMHASVGHVALAHAGRPTHAAWLAATIRAAERLSLLGIGAGLVGGAALWRLGITGDLLVAMAALAALVPLAMWDYFSIQLLSNSGQVGHLNRVLLTGRTAAAVAALAGGQLGPAGALAGLALGLATGGVLALRELRHARAQPVDVALTAPFRAGLLMHASALGSIIIAQGPVLVLAKSLGESEAGQYLLAFQLLSAFLVLPTATSLGLAARISREGPQGAWRNHLRSTTIVSILTGALAALAWFARRPLLFVLGESNHLAVALFQGLLPALVGWPTAIMMTPQWVARGLLWQTSVLTLLLAACNVGLAFLLVALHGVHGAASATSVTFGIALLMNLGLGLHARAREKPGQGPS